MFLRFIFQHSYVYMILHLIQIVLTRSRVMLHLQFVFQRRVTHDTVYQWQNAGLGSGHLDNKRLLTYFAVLLPPPNRYLSVIKEHWRWHICSSSPYRHEYARFTLSSPTLHPSETASSQNLPPEHYFSPPLRPRLCRGDLAAKSPAKK